MAGRIIDARDIRMGYVVPREQVPAEPQRLQDVGHKYPTPPGPIPCPPPHHHGQHGMPMPPKVVRPGYPPPPPKKPYIIDDSVVETEKIVVPQAPTDGATIQIARRNTGGFQNGELQVGELGYGWSTEEDGTLYIGRPDSDSTLISVPIAGEEIYNAVQVLRYGKGGTAESPTAEGKAVTLDADGKVSDPMIVSDEKFSVEYESDGETKVAGLTEFVADQMHMSIAGDSKFAVSGGSIVDVNNSGIAISDSNVSITDGSNVTISNSDETVTNSSITKDDVTESQTNVDRTEENVSETQKNVSESTIGDTSDSGSSTVTKEYSTTSEGSTPQNTTVINVNKQEIADDSERYVVEDISNSGISAVTIKTKEDGVSSIVVKGDATFEKNLVAVGSISAKHIIAQTDDETPSLLSGFVLDAGTFDDD